MARSAQPQRMAVIGGGLAGLACAKTLRAAGRHVAIFDKGRAPGGRVTTKRVPPYAFDLGAQYFTARAPRFMAQVEAWLASGACQEWAGRLVSMDVNGHLATAEPQARYVGTPGMSALAGTLALGLDVRSSHRVDNITRRSNAYALAGIFKGGQTLPASARADLPKGAAPSDLGEFDQLAICLPAPQAAQLLASDALLAASSLWVQAAAAKFAPCFAVGVIATPQDGEAFKALRALPFDGALIRGDGPLGWLARNSSKPGRLAKDDEHWVLHASPPWSREHALRALPEVSQALVSALVAQFGLPAWEPTAAYAHRWAFARAESAPMPPLGRAMAYDAALGVGLAGDWLADGRIEGAYLSGVDLAQAMIAAAN